MSHANNTTKREKIKRMAHFLAGSVILMHGYERWEGQHHFYLLFFIAGIVFLAVATFHHRLAARFRLVDTVFFFIEATLSFIIAYEYFEAGKKAVPFVYILAGCFQLVAIFIFHRKTRRLAGNFAKPTH